MSPCPPIFFSHFSSSDSSSRQLLEEKTAQGATAVAAAGVTSASGGVAPSLPQQVTKKTKKKKKVTSTPLLNSAYDDHALDQSMLQKRCVLHHRVEKFCELQKLKLQNQVQDLQIPGRFVYYDVFWLEQYMDCFVDCEDWSWLMRCGQQFRSKVMK
jgi:hypothetical protein